MHERRGRVRPGLWRLYHSNAIGSCPRLGERTGTGSSRCRLRWFRRCSARHARPLPLSSATWAPLPRSSLPVCAPSFSFRLPSGACVWRSCLAVPPDSFCQFEATEIQEERGGAFYDRQQCSAASRLAHAAVLSERMRTKAGGGDTGTVETRAEMDAGELVQESQLKRKCRGIPAATQ